MFGNINTRGKCFSQKMCACEKCALAEICTRENVYSGGMCILAEIALLFSLVHSDF